MNKRTFSFLFLVSVGLGFILLATQASAQGPSDTPPKAPQGLMGTAFTYQGQLKNASGPVNGSCDFTFGLWNALLGGAPVGSPVVKTGVNVGNGLFTVLLDFGAGAFDGSARYLDIAVRCPAGSGSYTALTPREELTPTPYALNADTLDGRHASGFWGVNGNSGTTLSNFLGTTDDVTLTLRVNNQIAWRLVSGNGDTFRAANVIGGTSNNGVTSGTRGATIAGGGALLGCAPVGMAPCPNQVTGDFGTIGGGLQNTSAGAATVAGGWGNTASGFQSTVGGGLYNTASGMRATVPGGYGNSATMTSTLAAGTRAKAQHQGAFVWGDSTDADIASTANDQFIVRANGGSRFIGAGNWDLNATEGDFRVGNDSYRLKIGVSYAGAGGTGDVWMRAQGGTNRLFIWTPGGTTILTDNAQSTGATLASGSGSWSSYSDRAVKANFTSVNGKDILERVAVLPIQTWNYNSQDAAIRHIGPMAQDFYAAFSVGEDDKHISTVDADGVALAAIQGLYQEVREKDANIAALQSRVQELEKQNASMDARLSALEHHAGVSPWALPGMGWLLGGLLVAFVIVRRSWRGGAR